jgi:broad specificity phosphatase PhoE
MTRRWRGFKDVDLSLTGRVRSTLVGTRLRHAGGFDIIYHDHLSRCYDTARLIEAPVLAEDRHAGPWNMGQLFEGRPINEDSLRMARWYIVGNQDAVPPGGEPFKIWSRRWYRWVKNVEFGFAAAAAVTHNRNIQYLYAMQGGEFDYSVYDCHGPDFCTVHVFNQRTGEIAPWGGRNLPAGFLYLIRHGDTE